MSLPQNPNHTDRPVTWRLTLQSLYPSEYPTGDPSGADWLWYHPGISRANGLYTGNMLHCRTCDCAQISKVRYNPSNRPENCWNCGRFVTKKL